MYILYAKINSKKMTITILFLIGIAGVVFRFSTDLLENKLTDALKELPVDGLNGEDIYGMVNSLSLKNAVHTLAYSRVTQCVPHF
jgi:hypothetical protein